MVCAVLIISSNFYVIFLLLIVLHNVPSTVPSRGGYPFCVYLCFACQERISVVFFNWMDRKHEFDTGSNGLSHSQKGYKAHIINPN